MIQPASQPLLTVYGQKAQITAALATIWLLLMLPAPVLLYVALVLMKGDPLAYPLVGLTAGTAISGSLGTVYLLLLRHRRRVVFYDSYLIYHGVLSSHILPYAQLEIRSRHGLQRFDPYHLQYLYHQGRPWPITSNTFGPLFWQTLTEQLAGQRPS